MNVEDLIQNYTSIERKSVGTREVKNPDKKWFTFWKKKYITETIYEEVEYVDLNGIKDETLVPIEELVEKNIQSAIQFTETELSKLKEFFVAEIDRLEHLMKERVLEIQNLANKSEDIKGQLEEHQEKREWLTEFIRELNQVLELKEKEVLFHE